MGNLKPIRDAVKAIVNGFRPTSEVSLPDPLIDYMVFGAAAEAMERYNSSRRVPLTKVESWMVTYLECQAATLHVPLCPHPSCKVSYYIDLPFELASLPDEGAIRSISISKSGLPMHYMPRAHWSFSGLVQSPPDRDNMKYSPEGQRIYFLVGDRDLTKCKLNLQLVAGGPRKDTVDLSAATTGQASSYLASISQIYVDTVEVAYPPHGRQTVIDAAATNILRYLGIAPDLSEDGNFEPKPAQQ